jgi:hypothetical protein
MTDREYTSQQRVEDFLKKTLEYSLNDYILAVQDYIEGYTGRIFSACSSASSRLFDGMGKQELLIDDCVEITKVEVGNDQYGNTFTELSSTGTDRYIPLPNNYSALKIPITKLLLTSRIFDFGIQNARITAKWGYSETPPADIMYIATVLVAGMYNAKYSVNGINNETIGSYSVSYNNQEQLDAFNKALTMLQRYKKHYL